jgi:hypothetical protein
MNEIMIDIAKDYTTTPGGRYVTDGKFSGEDFRNQYLEKFFKNQEDVRITINLDGTEGYPTSFLEECFGGLSRKYGKELCEKILNFKSEEDTLLIKEIKSYINDAIVTK